MLHKETAQRSMTYPDLQANSYTFSMSACPKH